MGDAARPARTARGARRIPRRARAVSAPRGTIVICAGVRARRRTAGPRVLAARRGPIAVEAYGLFIFRDAIAAHRRGAPCRSDSTTTAPGRRTRRHRHPAALLTPAHYNPARRAAAPGPAHRGRRLGPAHRRLRPRGRLRRRVPLRPPARRRGAGPRPRAGRLPRLGQQEPVPGAAAGLDGAARRPRRTGARRGGRAAVLRRRHRPADHGGLHHQRQYDRHIRRMRLRYRRRRDTWSAGCRVRRRHPRHVGQASTCCSPCPTAPNTRCCAGPARRASAVRPARCGIRWPGPTCPSRTASSSASAPPPTTRSPPRWTRCAASSPRRCGRSHPVSCPGGRAPDAARPEPGHPGVAVHRHRRTCRRSSTSGSTSRCWRLGLHVNVAKTISFIAGTTTAYLINRRWTFQAPPSTARFIAVCALYATTFVAQVGINYPSTRLWDDKPGGCRWRSSSPRAPRR